MLKAYLLIPFQTDAHAFNKGLLMNAAVIESSKRVPFDCIIFHDVDLVPVLGDDVYYNCPAYPRHLSVKIDKFNYTNLLLKIALKRYRLDGLNTAKYRVITTNVTSVCDLLGNDRSTCLWRSLNLFHFLIHPVPISGSNVLQIFHKH
ncbi:unnamed protein product [Mesocestoides corti]|uniref:Galactosyltransferase N-terminal domain-containing protein n=1 Tax=Mesocestoides corti TaxID=53468 RepID=A0A3P6HJB2_MESCO|nr:unnamed protein product [Mesocestoides corti]